MANTKWTDERLDALMHTGDSWADKLFEPHDTTVVRSVMNQVLRGSLDGLAPDVKKQVEDFFSAYKLELVDTWTQADRDRMRKAQRAYLAFAFPAMVCLLLSAVPQGYCAPRLARVLTHTELLEKATLRRLLGVLQMVLDVIFVGGFEDGGKAVRTGANLRIVHAALRRLLHDDMARPPSDPQHLAWDLDTDGEVISREDMLGTLMGFSLLVIDGLPAFGINLPAETNENVWFLWRNFGRTLGIPDRFVPVDADDARAFYEQYKRRHFRKAGDNPDGVRLAEMNIQTVAELLRDQLPFPFRVPRSAEWITRSVMVHLMGPKLSKDLDVHPPLGGLMNVTLDVLEFFSAVTFKVVTQTSDRKGIIRTAVRRGARAMNEALFTGLINVKLGGRPVWQIPGSLTDLWKYVNIKVEIHVGDPKPGA